MSGELQTIPARHGVATFVPRGRTIKIINTYGKQVVSTWAFGLHAPPEGNEEDGKGEEEEEDIEEKVRELKEEIEKDNKEEEKASGESENKKPQEAASPPKEENDTAESKEGAEDPPEQAPDTPENEKTTETADGESPQSNQPSKRTWSSYLPSIPYRSKATQQTNATPPKTQAESEKAQNEAASKKWSSYLPTGKGFSSYVPNVQIPDSKGVVSAFQASHYRDPNKSYAEQLYDFSKTPVGAGSLAAATGSGTASSLYAAYNAYTKLNAGKSDQPPMEYLSLPHTRASTHRLVPVVNDTLLTNLRSPIMTLVEDTTPGAHDTLTAACDANLYSALGTDKPEEHGSCAENLVLALKELNEKAGLKGTKAIGADITVNIAPTPLHLFMNAPLSLDFAGESQPGSGAKGATLQVEEPTGKKRTYVRFRAERDIVVVLSACPMDVGPQNGGRCMAANFMVEEASPSDDDDDALAASTSSIKNPRAAPKKLASAPTAQPTGGKDAGGTAAEAPTAKSAPPGATSSSFEEAPATTSEPRRDSAADGLPASELPAQQDDAGTAKETDDAPKPEEKTKTKTKKKPKKLERRGGTATPSKSETSGP